MKYVVLVKAIAESKPLTVIAANPKQARYVAMKHYDNGCLEWTPDKPQVVVMPHRGKYDAPYNRRHFLTLRALSWRIRDCKSPQGARNEYRRLLSCALNDEERHMLLDALEHTLSTIRWNRRRSRNRNRNR